MALYSFGAFMTVCEISRNDALRRVEAILKTGRDPGYESGVAAPPRAPPSPEAPTAAESEAPTAAESEVDLDLKDGRNVATAKEFVRFLVAEGWLMHYLNFSGERMLPSILALLDQPVWLDPSDPHHIAAVMQVASRPLLTITPPL